MATTTPVVVQRGPVKVATIKRKVGRPSRCTPEVTDAICSSIASGKSMAETLRNDPSLPDRSRITNWLSCSEPDASVLEFRSRYAQARLDQAEVWADEIVDISDDASNDYIAGEDGRPRFNAEAAARSRLRVDARKWILSKLLRKKYGDEPATAVTVNNVNVTLDEDTRMKLIEAHQRMQSKFSEKVITLPEQAA